jgi:hypothetical protein
MTGDVWVSGLISNSSLGDKPGTREKFYGKTGRRRNSSSAPIPKNA